ncbi:MAG: twin-arginine translocase TatA/TatE family subunit [Rikenellaceae bacterium]|nr:twin-arginine translocase TatA/TatE family subunit [Rikenellaceae bacterium]MCL2692738.1 twin-arginine translocase TatA/TatE family subunit [Rikenellaceae bacterium]
MMLPLFMRIGGPQILLIVLVVILLFGGRKIPELMKGLGKGMKSFKDALNGKDEEPASKTTDTTEEKETEK